VWEAQPKPAEGEPENHVDGTTLGGSCKLGSRPGKERVVEVGFNVAARRSNVFRRSEPKSRDVACPAQQWNATIDISPAGMGVKGG
jgi:hypothetical protein